MGVGSRALRSAPKRLTNAMIRALQLIAAKRVHAFETLQVEYFNGTLLVGKII